MKINTTSIPSRPERRRGTTRDVTDDRRRGGLKVRWRARARVDGVDRFLGGGAAHSETANALRWRRLVGFLRPTAGGMETADLRFRGEHKRVTSFLWAVTLN